MTHRYLVVFEKSPENYSSFAPDVPGCVSAGDTLEETRSNMIEALQFNFDGMLEDGQPIPEPSTTSYDFAEEDPEHGVEHCVVEWLSVPLPVVPVPNAAQGGERIHG